MHQEWCFQLGDLPNLGLARLPLHMEAMKEETLLYVNKIASDPYKFRQSKVKCVCLRDGNREQRSERRRKQAVDLASPFLPKKYSKNF